MRARIALCSIALALIVAPAPASAHAYVDASVPADGSTVAVAPRTIRISFDEPVQIQTPGAVIVRDARGVPIACVPAATVDPYDITSVTCPLARKLAKGRYTVAWRVTSADTHVVRGTIVFGIGVSAGSAVAATSTPFDPSAPLATILRALMLYGTLIACGAFAFDAFVGRRIAANERLRARCTMLAAIGSSVALVACLPALVVQAVAATGAGDATQLESALASTIGSTAWGHAWVLHAIALATLLGLAQRRGALVDRVALIAAFGALLAFSISGHATGTANVHLAIDNVVADVVHLAGAAMWIGGLLALILASPLRDPRAAIVAFTPLASAAALAIALSGTYASIVHIGAIGHLTDNAYGIIVFAKIMLFGVLVALGARNLARGRGLLGAGGFVRETAIEGMLALVAIALSAMLTGLAPPHAAIAVATNTTP